MHGAGAVVVEVWHPSVGDGDIASVKASVEGGAIGLDVRAALWA